METGSIIGICSVIITGMIMIMFKWYLNRKNINNSPPHDDVISRDIKQLRKEIDDIKKPGTGITWGDTCMQKHTEIDRRLGKLENGN